MKKLISFIFIGILAFALVGCQSSVSKENVVESNKFIDFVSEDLNGNEVTQDIFSETTITLVNIWGTSCPPCIDEMPDLEEINNELSSDEFQIIGIVAGGKPFKNEAQDILKQLEINYTNLFFTNQDFAKLEVQFVPMTFLVNSNGEILEDPIIGALSKTAFLDKINGYLNK
jgi:thiol-disulfide isomerase/thioredoxin